MISATNYIKNQHILKIRLQNNVLVEYMYVKGDVRNAFTHNQKWEKGSIQRARRGRSGYNTGYITVV